MEIHADFALNPRSVEEFARVLVPEALTAVLQVTTEERDGEIRVGLRAGGREAAYSWRALGDPADEQKTAMVKTLLLRLYGKSLSWGSLMGVRPTKVLRRYWEKGFTFSETREIFRAFYDVSPEKTDLLHQVLKRELALLNRDAVNMYIGIPYCRTRCVYCSFASYEIGGGVGRYYRDFLESLHREIDAAGAFLKKHHFTLESLYIGGGTPSILEESDLEALLGQIEKSVPLENLLEYTFEAGREDSLTREKLALMKVRGVRRISLNPQSFNEETLRRINRPFDRRHFDQMYEAAKALGFLLNMDIIIGLPGETTEQVLFTLKELKKYDPDNLTIHSLAFKRHSRLFFGEKGRIPLDKDRISDEIARLTAEMDLMPYYLYRQKNLMEWGENVGYAKEGLESRFNVEMIEENQVTVGLGGGAVTKLITKDSGGRDVVKRLINPKEPALYIRELDERLAEKLEKLRQWKAATGSTRGFE
ncbi:MAG: coproporphyrinogen III oxidase [Fusobacteriaceae bacterium]|nr:coproporphyrinogen III oxidase [Fusobacteriaceae bacterium]